MLVPSMTLEEVRRELEKDFPILYRKTGYVCHKLEKLLSKRQKEQGFHKFYEYYSKYKNRWIYKVDISKKESRVTSMTYYYNDLGLAGVSLVYTSNTLIYHTGHFFSRYNERNNLGIVLPIDVMRKFMEDTPRYRFRDLQEVAPGIKKVFGVVKRGVILGMHNENLNLYKANTFLTHEMLNKNQLEMEAELRKQGEKYVKGAGGLE